MKKLTFRALALQGVRAVGRWLSQQPKSFSTSRRPAEASAPAPLTKLPKSNYTGQANLVAKEPVLFVVELYPDKNESKRVYKNE